MQKIGFKKRNLNKIISKTHYEPKRRFRSSDAQAELHKSFDLNFQTPVIEGTVAIKIESILAKIVNVLDNSISVDGFIDINFSKNNLDTFSFPVPTRTTIKQWFHEHYFKANFSAAFRVDFPSEPLKCHTFGLLMVYVISTGLSSNLQPNIEDEDLPIFRLLVCLFFSWFADVKIRDVCSCYPKNPGELTALQVGIFKNCYDFDCQQATLKYPQIINSFTHTNDCTNIVQQTAVISLNIFATQNINFDKISINQISNCFQKTQFEKNS